MAVYAYISTYLTISLLMNRILQFHIFHRCLTILTYLKAGPYPHIWTESHSCTDSTDGQHPYISTYWPYTGHSSTYSTDVHVYIVIILQFGFAVHLFVRKLLCFGITYARIRHPKCVQDNTTMFLCLFTFLSTPVQFAQWAPMHHFLSVYLSVWVCETYIVHHLVCTGLRCAPSTCIVHNQIKVHNVVLYWCTLC